MKGARWLLAGAAFASLASPFCFVLAAILTGLQPGFPLDDAWIHQVFGESLARQGILAFNPGEPSTASTSPLWTLLLAAGISLGLPAYAWTMFLGGASLLLLAGAVHLLGQRLFPGYPIVGPLAALAVVIEWHLAWAAASGMETVLFTALTVLLVVVGSQSRFDPLVTGVLAGLTILTRSEASVLFAIVLSVRLVYPPADARQRAVGRLARLFGAGVLSLVVVAPYAAFSVAVSGSVLPSTFAAKTAFYGQPVTLAFAVRFIGAVLSQVAISPATLLIPLAIIGAAVTFRQRGTSPSSATVVAWSMVFPWTIALIALYLIRLPVVYQHGRYFIPLMPWFVVAVVGGCSVALVRLNARRLRLVTLTVAAGAWGAMWWLGLSAWLFDVGFIGSYQVAAGRWIAAHAPAGAIVATHDVGAIRRYGGRRVVDIAGLITPEVVPIVHDGRALTRYLEARRIDYLVAFPNWVPGLTDDERLVEVARFRTAAVSAAGAEDLVIYRADWR